MNKVPKIGFNPLILILAVLVGLMSCDDGFEGVGFDPIRCENDTIRINEEGLQLVIDGGIGLVDCIMAGINCNLNIEAEDIILINCRECIRAEFNGIVTLSAFGDIKCDAIDDGISARGGAAVRLNAIEDIAIFSFEGNGIRAEDMSAVLLDTLTGTCIIDGFAGDIVQDDTAVVSTDGCNKVDFLEGLD
jgi:hypothetical protein